MSRYGYDDSANLMDILTLQLGQTVLPEVRDELLEGLNCQATPLEDSIDHDLEVGDSTLFVQVETIVFVLDLLL